MRYICLQISVSTQSFLSVLSAVLMQLLVNLACSLAAEVSTTGDQGELKIVSYYCNKSLVIYTAVRVVMAEDGKS